MRTASGTSSRRPAPAVAAPSGGALSRFDLVERLVHWSTAVLLITLIVTGAILYFPILALRIGHRGLMENIHVITGLCLLGPLVLGLLGPWRERLLTDLRRIDRWRRADFEFFRSRRRRARLPS